MTDLITTHPSADFDGVASMVAARHLYPGAILAFSGSAEEKVRDYLSAGAPVEILNPKQVETGAVTRVVLCDTHTPERAGHFADLCTRVPVHAFDHHPVEAGEFRPEKGVIEVVGATTTLLAGLLQERNIEPTPWEATLMALGIYEETGCLTFATTTPRDAGAVAWLLERGADLGALRTRLQSELTLEQLELLDALAHQLEVRYIDGFKVGVAAAYASRYVPEVAHIANRLLAIEPMDALVVLIAMEEKVLLVARGTDPKVALEAVAQRFGGGGHPTAASAMMHDHTLIEATDAVWAALDALIAPLNRAGTIMTRNPVTVPATTLLPEAERVLTRYGVNTLPVMDGEQVVGIVSRETVQKGLHHGLDATPVADVMEGNPYTVTPDTPLREVQDRMVVHNRRFVPVLSDGRLVGCITRTDLLRTMHEDLRTQESGAGGREARHKTIRDQMRRQLPREVYRLLQEIGEEGARQGVAVYMAGGIVRDMLLGHENLDIDLVVEGEAIPFASGWAERCGARVHTHERFGTATVTLEREGLPPNFKVDLATTRTEYYEYPSALPTVEHSSLKKDLYRRDFTINALAVALHPPHFGTLIDYFGGQRDLKDGHIRVLHTLSFTEDPTRALRAVRFATRYGFSIDQQTERLIGNAAKMGLYARLSGKRLLTELRHIFSDAEPVAALTQLGRLGVLEGIDPLLGDDETITRVIGRISESVSWYRLQFFEEGLEVWQVYLLGLSDVFPPDRRSGFWERLDLPGRIRDEWERWLGLPERAKGELRGKRASDPLAIYRCFRGASPEVLVHLMAATERKPLQQAVSVYLSRLAGIRIETTGHDLKHMGIPEGPLYRDIMEGLLSARIRGEVQDREQELEWVRKKGYA